LGFVSLDISNTVSKVSAVGAGMVGNPGVAAQMFEALASANINIQIISTSEIKVSVLVDKVDADMAVQAIHDSFFGSPER
jgi:aspartate kinase